MGIFVVKLSDFFIYFFILIFFLPSLGYFVLAWRKMEKQQLVQNRLNIQS